MKSYLFLILFIILSLDACSNKENDEINSFIVNPNQHLIKFYWKNSKGEILLNLFNLKKEIETAGDTLLFAMNGGMYHPNYAPVGLYIENGIVIHPLNTDTGTGNFYMQPNGVFYLDKQNQAHICVTQKFKSDNAVLYATQSGPMLVLDGAINSVFSKISNNLNIRNGVGILPDNRVIFAISKNEISFYDFANYFKSMGCKQALYLDGKVSKAYIQGGSEPGTSDKLGVLIGVTKKH